LFGCELTGRVMTLIQKNGCKIDKGDFQAQTRIHLRIRKSKAEQFRQDLINATSGKIQFLREDDSAEA
jgi:putative IMPACT (imprinted ancient) family translation regulator